MANEARVFAEGVGPEIICRQFTVADATAVAKGAWLTYSNATRTGVLHTGTIRERPLGPATSSKAASDGVTEIAVQRTGVVVATADGVITTGDLVTLGDTANMLRALTMAAFSKYEDLQAVVGRALESAADAGRFKVALCLG